MAIKTFSSTIPGHRLRQARAWCTSWSPRQLGWFCRGSYPPSQRSTCRPWCSAPRRPRKTSRRASHCPESPGRPDRSRETFVNMAIIHPGIFYLYNWQLENRQHNGITASLSIRAAKLKRSSPRLEASIARHGLPSLRSIKINFQSNNNIFHNILSNKGFLESLEIWDMMRIEWDKKEYYLKASDAALTALSTSDLSPSCTWAIISPEAGFRVGKVFPDTLECHSLLMKIPVCWMQN